MICLTQILNKCSVAIEKCCITAWDHMGYVIHHKKNSKELQDESEKLENEVRRIDGRVERARNNGEIPEADVLQWIKSANEMNIDVVAFLGKGENKLCFNWCPNIYWRYWIGKVSKEKTDRVISLKDEGEKFMTLEVSHPVPHMKFGYNFSQGYEDFDSRAKIFKEIMKALEDSCVKMIGVYGAGGVGKTTMVVEVGKLAERNGLFDDVAMATISQTLDEKIVKEKLASQLGLTLNGNAGQLYRRLNNGKKNLVILDDVWENFNFADIEIPITNGNMGCTVVITSRKKGFCQMIRMPEASTKEILIGVLEEPEAWTLFKKTAGISIHSDIPSEAKEVCDKCGGLPVAIRAVAAALKGKGKHAWKDALRQLKNYKLKEIAGIDPDLFISLKWSYDRLEPKDARSCFLLCSLFPEDAEISIDDLVRYSVGMRLLDQNLNIFDEVRNRVLAMVDVLNQSCLLLDGTNENVVKMHDVIRDVAITIAEEEKGYLVKHVIKKWPEKDTYEHYSAISLRFTTNIQEPPDVLECTRLHTLVLKCRDSSPTNVKSSFFNGMENNLEILDLSEMPLKSSPSSLPRLVKLRMLCLNGLSRDIALLGRLKNLEILSLHGIEELAPEIRELTSLRLLDLENCTNLRVIPPNVISKLTQLEELYISDTFDQWEVEGTDQQRENASLLELNSLTLLKTLKVHMPRSMGLPKLTRFSISIGENIKYKENYFSTRILKLSLCGIPIENKFRDVLEKVEVLYLNKLPGLKKVLLHDRDGGGFLELRHLEVIECNDVECLLGMPARRLKIQPQSLPGSFSKLRELHVRNCGFKCLFSLSIARVLARLTHLEIENCEDMEEIVGNEGQENDEEIIFLQLKIMTLRNIPKLRSFLSNNSNTPQPLFCGKVAFPALEELRIFDVHNISVLENLKSFYDSCGPEEEKEESTKHELIVEILEPQPLFNQKVVFPCLEVLEIWSLGNIKEIWHSTPPTNSFNNLRHLAVFDCQNLLNIAPSELLGSLQNLQFLNVEDCGSLEEYIATLGNTDNTRLPLLDNLYGSRHTRNVREDW
ncbi:hypothetical protein TEA_002106 [Camellia sinensis var. sinensis]|uniref:Uncharacterized protein n=1 Tax=Camellia sinensis var. sinensis TaxID=542762 RepID=A0A4S4DCP4_CAMSN|nr:hypothetical protein TEA_002106 [Camellia sinensis var. sinensis]